MKVQYDPKPFVVDMEMARQADAPPVFPGPADEAGSAGGGGGPADVPQKGNVHGPSMHKRGDTEQGFKDADVIVESKYTTQVQVHNALETHGLVADWKPDLLTVWASTQGTASVRDELADYFKIPKSQVRVITEFVGGGFGAKFGAGNPGVVARHSVEANRRAGAVDAGPQGRAAFGWQSSQLRPDAEDRRQERWHPHRHSIDQLSARRVVEPARAVLDRRRNLYQSASLHTEENDVFINAGPAAAFRAPGHPQGAFALEQTIDEMAEKLNMEPLEFREKIDTNPVRRVERQIVRESAIWKSRNPKPNADPGPIKRGVGLSQSVWYRFVQHGFCRGSARASRRLGGSSLRSTGHRYRHQDGDGADSGRAVWSAAATGIGKDRRHKLSGRAELRRKRDDGFLDPGGARCGVAGFAEISGEHCSRAGHDAG